MSAPNRAQRIEQAMFLASLADKAKERAAAIRAELEEEARKELKETGTAPTWRLPGGGTVPLNMTQDAVNVADESAYSTYVHDTNPDEIETIVQVRPAFDKALREQAAKRGPALNADGEIIPGAARDAQGNVIPGLIFKPGGEPKGISIRPAAAAKEASLELAGVMVDSLLMSVVEVSQ